MIVVLPPSNDRLVLTPFDVDAALEKSGIDYLLVTTQPTVTARRGEEYVYPVAVKSKKGGVTYRVDSGPPGLSVSPAGEVRWRVPADFKGTTAEVILTVRDAAGQEAFHVFSVRITN